MGRVVSILHYSSLPVIGGVEFVIDKQVEMMEGDGIDVRVIAGEGKPDILIPEISSSHYKAIHKEILRGVEPDNFTEEVDKLTLRLKGAVSDSDLLIVHNVFTMHFNLVATSALINLIENQRTIAWVHDISYIDPTYELPPPNIPSLENITRPSERLEYVTITEYRKEKLIDFLSLDKERVEVIPNGIDPYQVLPPGMREVARELNILSFYPVVVYPSRLTRRKNFEFAIEITAKLKGNPLLLLSAPQDPHNPKFSSYKGELRSLADKKKVSLIFFSDYIPIEEIYPFYLLGDLLLITSKMEGFGIPVLESALMRLPSALSKIPPLSEVGRNFKNRIFFDLDENPCDVADRISDMLDKCVSTVDRREVINRYSWQKIYQDKIRALLKFS